MSHQVSQTFLLLHRFSQKANQAQLFKHADLTPRRLLKFKGEELEKFKKLAASINPAYITSMNDPSCLSETACNELIQIVIPE